MLRRVVGQFPYTMLACEHATVEGTMKTRNFWIGLLLLGVATAIGSPARADITAKDVQVMARALGFTEKPPSGEVNIAIVFAPGNPQSAKEADDLKNLMGTEIGRAHV